jgi:S1-C subfamily serine protease
MTLMRLSVVAIVGGIGLLSGCAPTSPAAPLGDASATKRVGEVTSSLSAEELKPIRTEVEPTLPRADLENLFEDRSLSDPGNLYPGAPLLVFRGAPPPGDTIYRDRVDGVVLLASTKAVATGVLVSDDGDIITNDHIVQHAHRARGEDWVAVWFRQPRGTRTNNILGNFLLARVVQRDPLRDLARLRLAQAMPGTATVVPLASVVPDVGQQVFTIGHPKSVAWSFSQGIVSGIHHDYQWRYDDGIPRAATAIQMLGRITPGNSGGPLLDNDGAMVGVMVGSALAAQDASFAVAVQHVRELLKVTARP